MKKYITKQSSIKGAGKGLFTNASFKKGEVIGLAHVDDQPASEIGRNHNHNEKNPTAYSKKINNKRFIYASKDLNPGEEITTNYRMQPELEQPEDFMRKGGSVLKMPNKKNSKGYSRSLSATNKLFTQNFLFEKPKSRKNKVFDPNSKYYAEGGSLLTKKVTCKSCGWKWDAEDGGKDITTCHKCGGQGLVHAQDGGNKDAMTGMMKARLAYANEFGNPAAERMINLPDNPYQFDNGDTGSHYMASMDNYAVPQIQDENGVLVLGDYGPESNEAIRFDSDEDANYFAENYKDVSPGFINQKKEGGEPCPKDFYWNIITKRCEPQFTTGNFDVYDKYPKATPVTLEDLNNYIPWLPFRDDEKYGNSREIGYNWDESLNNGLYPFEKPYKGKIIYNRDTKEMMYQPDIGNKTYKDSLPMTEDLFNFWAQDQEYFSRPQSLSNVKDESAPEKRIFYDPNSSKWYNANDQKQYGGISNDYIEADLDEDEIEEYRRSGYIVEEIDTFQNGGVYTVKGSKGNYKKVNGKWQVDWNRSGKYQPLSKGDVKARTAVLDKMAKPVDNGISKISSNSSDNTRVNNIYQKPLDWSFDPKYKNNIQAFVKKSLEEKEKAIQKEKEDNKIKKGLANNEGIKETVGQFNKRQNDWEHSNILNRLFTDAPESNYIPESVGRSPFEDSPMTGIGGAPKMILKAGKWLKPLWTGTKNVTQPFRQATVSALKAPLPLGKTITNATAGKLNLGNSVAAYFGADALYNQGDSNSDVRKSQSNLINNPSWNTLGDAAFETGVNSLGFSGLGLGKQVFKPTYNASKNLGKFLNSHPAGWFQSAEQKLVNPKLWKSLGIDKSGDPLGKFYDWRDIQTLKNAQKKEFKLIDKLQMGYKDEDRVKAVATIREKLGKNSFKNVQNRISESKSERSLRRSGLPVQNVITEWGTKMGGGQGQIFLNNLNPKEVIKLGLIPGKEGTMQALVNAGNEAKTAGVAGLENVALPTKAVSFGADPIRGTEAGLQFMPWLGKPLSAKNPIAIPFEYGQGSSLAKNKLLKTVEELDKKNIGIDYYGKNNIMYDPISDSYKIVDLNYTQGPGWSQHWNKLDLPAQERLESKFGKIDIKKQGGTTNDYVELDLTPEEIQVYKNGGYIVEEIDTYQKGGVNKKGKSYDYTRDPTYTERFKRFFGMEDVDDIAYEKVDDKNIKKYKQTTKPIEKTIRKIPTIETKSNFELDLKNRLQNIAKENILKEKNISKVEPIKNSLQITKNNNSNIKNKIVKPEDSFFESTYKEIKSFDNWLDNQKKLFNNGLNRKLQTWGIVETKDKKVIESPEPINVKDYYKNPTLSQTILNVNDEPNRQFKQQTVPTSNLVLGSRNRGQYQDIESDGLEFTTFHPFSKAANIKPYNKKTNVNGINDDNSVFALDNKGVLHTGIYKNLKNNKDWKFSRTFMNKIVSIDDISLDGSRSGNHKFWQPQITILENNKLKKGALNILTKKGKAEEDYYGSILGGRVVFVNPLTKEQTLVSGSVSHIKKEFKRLKGNSKYLEAWSLDNGTYARGLSYKDGKLTKQRLINYDAENTSGGNGLYIKKYNVPVNKFKENYVYDMPNVRTKKDDSYKAGHKLKNEIKNFVLHHTAYDNPITNEAEVKKQFMTPGQNSSHVVIEEDGSRTIYASPEQVSFHAGKSKWNGREDVNDFSIGVEFQGDTQKKPLTDQQVISFVEYYTPIAKKYNLNLKSIITHEQIRNAYIKKHANEKGLETKPDITYNQYKRILNYMKAKGIN